MDTPEGSKKSQKKGLSNYLLNPLNLLVPGPGIEPGTHGFSVCISHKYTKRYKHTYLVFSDTYALTSLPHIVLFKTEIDYFYRAT